ncbi:hypothetical protein [Aurantiacibacter aquimixticola]|uniref:TonB family protein n=1 Tax=Aurantiacibacter aquimixticola TaxID=1958945 RepID=A0A419RVM3_9SPHN|nr:hypothetical protein [Aurantiacibacter aquimixticola]RJY09831.1 hypothetical protein D6201_11110 [Aurantiacibacter aquimixticola]
MATGGYSTARKKLDWKLVVLIVILHVAALAGLARLLAPQFTADIIEGATTFVSVDVREIVEPEVEPSISPPAPDEGAAGNVGQEATPREVVAPEPEIELPRPSPAPRASSTGTANRSGARDRGDGTGAGGEGSGTGSGRGGSGTGGAVAVRPSVRSGELNEARDFPIPEGGRQARLGRSVTVQFIVTTDGRARNCTVANTQVDATTTARVCPLVIEKIRFNPATTADGTPVEARYGYRVDFRARS